MQPLMFYKGTCARKCGKAGSRENSAARDQRFTLRIGKTNGIFASLSRLCIPANGHALPPGSCFLLSSTVHAIMGV